MIKFLWAQCRDMRLEVFQNKLVYTIPVYNESIFKNFIPKVEYNDSCKFLRITLEPSKSIREKPLS
jgi:hypothetical protein